MKSLRVLTLNMWNDDYLRFERAHLVVEEIARLRPHLVALQELSIPHDMATWIVNRINEWTYDETYNVFPWNKIGPQGAFEGLAIITRLPVLKPSEAIDLAGGGRIAQRVVVKYEDRRVAFCNLHLHHSRGLESLRVAQVKHMSQWMDEISDCIPLIAGDFNCPPNEQAMNEVRKAWRSAHAAFYGGEPEFTFPTPPYSKNDAWHRPRVVDYILYKPSHTSVLDVRLCFNCPGGVSSTLLPSDHFGLLSDFELVPRETSTQ